MKPQHAVTGKALSDGCTLAYRIEGSQHGPAVLLSNSLGTTAEMWASQMVALTPEFRVIRYDTRGHGRSDAPPGEYTLDQLGRDAITVLDAVGVNRVHFCGLSLGGVTGMWLGLNAADRIESLVLASTAAQIGTVQMWNDRIRQVRDGGTASIADAVMTRWFTERFREQQPETVSAFRDMVASISARGYVGCCAALRSADLREAIARITAPTLVIAGALDPATPPADGREIQSRIGGAELVLLNASHLANVEQPAVFNQTIADFIFQRTQGPRMAESQD